MPFYNWSDANYGALNDYLQSVNWNFVFQTCFDTESCWATFHSILTDALDIFVPKICPKVTQRKGKPNRYYPRYIRDLIKNKAIAWKHWRVSHNECDKLKYKYVANKCIDCNYDLGATQTCSLFIRT